MIPLHKVGLRMQVMQLLTRRRNYTAILTQVTASATPVSAYLVYIQYSRFQQI